MRILILSCNTGEGHNACGRAIQEALLARGVPCEMEDTFRFISDGFSRLLTFSFVQLYRHLPWLFRWGYRYSEDHPAVFSDRSAVCRLLAAGTARLNRFIDQGGYDRLVCPHVLSALAATLALRQRGGALRTCFVATDYTCSPSCGQSDLDAYFIPDASLAGDFLRAGVPAERLIVSGIPLRRAFSAPRDRAAARARWGLPPGSRHLLIMCGSMGCGPLRSLVRLLVPALPEESCISLVCGTNRRLQRSLARELRGDSRLRIYGFVEEIPSLMDSADLYLTKPGGLSVTEAARRQLPMVFINAVAGCETYNTRFFTERGGAVTAETPEALARTALALLTDEAALARMRRALAAMPQSSPAETVATYILQPAPQAGAGSR